MESSIFRATLTALRPLSTQYLQHFIFALHTGVGGHLHLADRPKIFGHYLSRLQGLVYTTANVDESGLLQMP
jgi:hypothetical protein